MAEKIWSVADAKTGRSLVEVLLDPSVRGLLAPD
jgi:hypothetical protein